MNRQFSFQKTIRIFCSLLLAVTGVLFLSTSAFATYIHGYFLYEVADNSVTITAYTGKEDVVTVPAMIGGNPVNSIASGAFANCPTVTTVYLPDTIMSIEGGAFGGQAVVYSGNASGNARDAVPAENAPLPELREPSGIRDENGNLITTDDEGNLVLVDASTGSETVLDDTQTYSRETDSSGAAVIQNQAGSTVAVQSGGEVSFTDAENNQVTVSVSEGNSTRRVTNAESSQSYEEADAEDLPSFTPAPVPTQQDKSAPTPGPVKVPEGSVGSASEDVLSQRLMLLIGLFAVLVVLCIAAVIRSVRRRKRRH